MSLPVRPRSVAEQDVAAHAEYIQRNSRDILGGTERRDVSHSSGLPCCWGTTPEGRFLFCVYEKIDEITIYPVTAYEPSEE